MPSFIGKPGLPRLLELVPAASGLGLLADLARADSRVLGGGPPGLKRHQWLAQANPHPSRHRDADFQVPRASDRHPAQPAKHDVLRRLVPAAAFNGDLVADP
eukprot:scaffold1806_cov240-Pinguiococcus_pyrenoidosus.AAC.19